RGATGHATASRTSGSLHHRGGSVWPQRRAGQGERAGGAADQARPGHLGRRCRGRLPVLPARRSTETGHGPSSRRDARVTLPPKPRISWHRLPIAFGGLHAEEARQRGRGSYLTVFLVTFTLENGEWT